jgi:hypothetical protein
MMPQQQKQPLRYYTSLEMKMTTNDNSGSSIMLMMTMIKGS